MAVEINVKISGGDEYRRALSRLTPHENSKIKSLGLRAVALKVQQVAGKEKMIAGGKKSPHASKLTSRTGTGRRSIRTNFERLPGESQVGSDLKYMGVHESGGSFAVKSHNVRAHTRSLAFGKKVKPFTVPSFTRKAHSANFKQRPWLQPAVDDIVPHRAEQIMIGFWERQARSSG